MQSLVLNIGGMHCDACVRRVTQALEKVGGVTVEHVEVGSARVLYDPHTAAPQQIADAVNKIGFQARTA